MSRFHRNLTYANVVSSLALFLVVAGGSAIAANTIRSADIVDGEVKTADIAANAVTSLRVLNDTLTGVDIDESTLARVPDAARLGGVVARPPAQLVAPASTTSDRCSAQPPGTGVFCTFQDPFSGNYLARWGNFGEGWQPARFYKDAFGIVHLEGLVREGVSEGGASTIFILPAAYRPTFAHVFDTVGQAAGQSVGRLARVDVRPDGRVVLQEPPSDPGDVATTTYLSLDTISFKTG